MEEVITTNSSRLKVKKEEMFSRLKVKKEEM
jgi:hypothetical protein